MEYLSGSTSATSSDCSQVRRIRNYAFCFSAAWTLLLLTSSVLTIREQKIAITTLAMSEARAAIDRDIVYRHWCSSHGGVYAPVTEKNSPNPYLLHIPERDISTPSGRKLTLINPAYMTRQVYELAKETDLIVGSAHLTSLKPIRPDNFPDPWEKHALESFEKGDREASDMVFINGQPFMKLMRAFVTEKSCLKCHASQGYKEGDVRGGLSVTIPTRPLIDASHGQIFRSVSTHGLIWLLGLCMTGFGARQLTRSARA